MRSDFYLTFLRTQDIKILSYFVFSAFTGKGILIDDAVDVLDSAPFSCLSNQDFGNPVFLQEQLDDLQEAIDAYRSTCNQELLSVAIDKFSRNIAELSGVQGEKLMELLRLSSRFTNTKA